MSIRKYNNSNHNCTVYRIPQYNALNLNDLECFSQIANPFLHKTGLKMRNAQCYFREVNFILLKCLPLHNAFSYTIWKNTPYDKALVGHGDRKNMR